MIGFRGWAAALLGLGLFNGLLGATVLATRGSVWLPLVRWLRAMSDAEVALLVGLWGRGLMLLGLGLLLVGILVVRRGVLGERARGDEGDR